MRIHLGLSTFGCLSHANISPSFPVTTWYLCFLFSIFSEVSHDISSVTPKKKCHNHICGSRSLQWNSCFLALLKYQSLISRSLTCSYLHLCYWESLKPSVTFLKSIQFLYSLTCISYLPKERKFFFPDLIIWPATLTAVFLHQKRWPPAPTPCTLQRITGVGTVQTSTAGNWLLWEGVWSRS